MGRETSGNVVQLCIACFLLGMGSWITVNGLYQELPLIAQTAPEGYNIFSYTAVLVALSNIWPAAFVYFRSKVKASSGSPVWTRFDHWTTLLAIGVFGISTCIFLAFFYDSTAVLAGAERSVALLILIFLSGGVDCMTSVLFYPLVAPFPSLAVTVLIVGEAATGLLAAGLAAVQTASAHFTVSLFFVVLAVVMAASSAAYIWLYWKYLSQERQASSTASTCEVVQHASGQQATLQDRWLFAAYQAALAVVENGIHAVLLPHAVRQYDFIQWSVHLSFAGAALCTLLAHFHPLTSGGALGRAAHSAVAVTAIATIAASATRHAWPAYLIATIVVLCKCLVAYAKTSGFVGLKGTQRQTSNMEGGEEAAAATEDTQDKARLLPLSTSSDETHHTAGIDALYRWGGIGIQVGSCLGAVLFFLLTVVSPVLSQAST